MRKRVKSEMRYGVGYLITGARDLRSAIKSGYCVSEVGGFVARISAVAGGVTCLHCGLAQTQNKGTGNLSIRHLKTLSPPLIST